jgi:hypothetical protein
MDETTHLLLPEQQHDVDADDRPTVDMVRTVSSSLATKEINWWEDSLRNVFWSQRSINDTKRRALLSGNIGAAAYLIRDAVVGDNNSVVEDPTTGAYNPFSSTNSNHVIRNEISITCRKYCSSWSTLRMLYCSVAALILLTFLEPPHWCRNLRLNMIAPEGQQEELFLGSCDTVLRLSGTSASATEKNDMMTSSIVEFYPNTATAVWLSVSQSHLVEIICIMIIATVVILRIGRDGCSLTIYLRRSAGSTIQWNRICQIVCIVALVAGVCLEHRTHDEQFTKLHPYIRLILLYTFLGGIQRDIQVLLGMLPVSFYFVSQFTFSMKYAHFTNFFFFK